MKSGYKILWTDHALSELKETIEYLEEAWSEKEIKNFVHPNTPVVLYKYPQEGKTESHHST